MGEPVRVEELLDVFAEEALMGSQKVEHMREWVFRLQAVKACQPLVEFRDKGRRTLSMRFVPRSPSNCHLNRRRSGCTSGFKARSGFVSGGVPGTGEAVVGRGCEVLLLIEMCSVSNPALKLLNKRTFSPV